MSAQSMPPLAAPVSQPRPVTVPASVERPDPVRAEVQELAPAAPPAPEKAPVDFDPQARQRELREAVERLNEQMRENARALAFTVDKVLERTVVTVKNSETGQVVRQIPDETLLRVAHNLEEVKGLLQDDRA